jgi:hypothetical protein
LEYPWLIKNVDMWGLLKQAIEQEMQNKGYTQIADAGQADLNISFMAALESSMVFSQPMGCLLDLLMPALLYVRLAD